MFDETSDSIHGREPRDREQEAADGSADEPADDTLSRALTAEERAKLAIDSWEPSLLRNLLDAHGKLKR